MHLVMMFPVSKIMERMLCFSSDETYTRFLLGVSWRVWVYMYSAQNLKSRFFVQAFSIIFYFKTLCRYL